MDASKILHAIIGPLPPNGLYHANTIQNLSMVIYYETKLSTINIQISCANGYFVFSIFHGCYTYFFDIDTSITYNAML